MPELVEEIIAAIQREVRVYQRPLAGEFGDGIRRGTEVALRRFLGAGGEDTRAVYRSLGRGEHRSGRTLDALQAAYRVGARVAWGRMSEIAATAGADEGSQRRLAGAMFAYVEEIAAESIEGHAEAQLAQASEREREREALAAQIIAAPGPSDATLKHAAGAVGWRLPAKVAALAVDAAVAASVRRRLGADVLAAQVGALACVLVPDPAGLETASKTVARRSGCALGVGPTVALADAHRSWRLAQLAHSLTRGRATVVLAEERIAELVLLAAGDLLPTLEARALAPLEHETASSQRRLQATLRCWLALKGSQSAVAEALAVHPQTVRYRIRRLRELFGDALDDPDRRFELELALRSRQLAD